MGQLLNILIGGLRFLRIDYVNVVVSDILSRISCHLIRVEYQDQRPLPGSLIIGHQIHQPVPGSVNVRLRQFPQLVPGKYNIISVHQEIILFLLLIGTRLRPGRPPLFFSLASGADYRSPRFFGRALWRPEGAVKNLLQLPVHIIGFPQTAGSGCVCFSVPGACLRRLAKLLTGPRFPLLYRLFPGKPAFHLHIFLNLIPGHRHSRPMEAEHGSSRILDIAVKIIPDPLDHFFFVMAWAVTGRPQGKSPTPSGVGNDLLLIIPHFRYRSDPRKDRASFRLRRRVKRSLHPLHIRHGPAQVFRGQFQHKLIKRLQKTAAGFLQSLAHRPVGRLAEISALRVFDMRSSGNQRNLHIRNLRAGENAAVALLLQMGQNQSLPVPIQHVLTAVRFQHQPAASLQRLHQKMDLRIMAKRFKMSHALHSLLDRFFINNFARSKTDFYAKPVQHLAF